MQSPPPNSVLVGKIAKIAKIVVFPLKLNRVMVFTHILHHSTWCTTFSNDIWGGFNSLEHKSETCLFRGNIKCISNLWMKNCIFTFFTILDHGPANLFVIYPYKYICLKCRGYKSVLTSPPSVYLLGNHFSGFPRKSKEGGEVRASPNLYN